MKRTVVISLAVLCSIVTALLVSVVVQRLGWEYNEKGVYFDEASATTYDQGARDAYLALAFLFLIPTIILFLKALKSPPSDDVPPPADQPF